VVFQLSVIIFAAWAGGYVFNKIKLPTVLGEIVAGMLIGPYCLGKISFAGFSNGMFPIANTNFPISPELYSYATIASIILLFSSGLETDLKTFLKYSLTASAIGISEVIVSFILGDILGIIFAKYALNLTCHFADTIPLFAGLIAVATSVGIGARILSEKKKMDSPEGVTILAAALFDDILGIIFLAMVIGIVKSGHVEWLAISLIGLKSIVIWLIFTALGLFFAYKISGFLKLFKDRITITIISFGLALLLAGIFEKSGLTMIIGAYIMGLSLSKTDVSLTIRENIAPLNKLLVPIFFCVIGMLFDISQFGQTKIILFGLLYFAFVAFGKVFGAGFPALFLNFTPLGALRIGVGMIPHGEVTLIILGIGLSAGLIPKEIFSISIIMTFLTILITPSLLEKLLSEKSGIRKQNDKIDLTRDEIIYKIPNQETLELVMIKILNSFEREGFFVATLDSTANMYQVRKDTQVISFSVIDETTLVFDCLKKDSPFINTLFFEVLADLEHMIHSLKTLTDKESIVKSIFVDLDNDAKFYTNIKNTINPLAVNINLKGETKEQILEELVDILIKSKDLQPEFKDEVFHDLLNREDSLSTGMKNGMDFSALDGKPSTLFIVTLAPKNAQNPYLKFISDLTQFLSKNDLNNLLSSRTARDLYEKLIR
jgi:Kef-type K+ transport system membrane component KefB/mannitol/fructose-specific phosphotransferase system IIA component (Ntr-type)